MMYTFFLIQGDYFLRVFVACLCGCLIGYERENHLKLAGVRTHSIVALASALMVIVSKYGFFDVLSDTIRLDPSRVAAGIVTAIGFLGGSVIFTRKFNISGLTTAAGIWATVGIGMAIGAGMYTIGICSTILLLLLQYIFHLNFRLNQSPSVVKITIHIEKENDVFSILEHPFGDKKIYISNFKIERLEENLYESALYINIPDISMIRDVSEWLSGTSEVISIEM